MTVEPWMTELADCSPTELRNLATLLQMPVLERLADQWSVERGELEEYRNDGFAWQDDVRVAWEELASVKRKMGEKVASLSRRLQGSRLYDSDMKALLRGMERLTR